MNLQHMPFSRYGAWLAITGTREEGALTVHDAHHDFGRDRIAEIKVLDEGSGLPVPAENSASCIVLGRGRGRLWLADNSNLGIEASGLRLHITALGGSAEKRITERSLSWQTGPEERPTEAVLEVFRGRISDPWLEPDEEGRVSASLHVGSGRPCPLDSERQISEADMEWQDFKMHVPKVRPQDTELAEAAWYSLWCAFMRKEGPWKYDAVVMTKAVMTWVWSWDHCFTALALGLSQLPSAMDQFLLPFPLMNDQGCLPDMWKAPDQVEWYATKPPIHGWALSKLMDQGAVPIERLGEAYAALVRWTEFWLEHRDNDHDGIPNYLVSGNDSGWDNSTLFDHGAEIESPELSGYLILQLKALARAAERLGKTDEALSWKRRSGAMKDALIQHSWDGRRFLAKKSGVHSFDPEPTSLLPLMTLAMGEELDPKMAAALADQLQPFLTDHGLSTELTTSPHYRPDGYWRGPIWAPSTYLICDGLDRASFDHLSRKIKERFLRMVRDKAGGFYENFDALTGKGNCAPGYTWTSAVSLLMMKDLAEQEAGVHR